MPRTSPSLLTISVTTSPQPPWRLTRRRNAVSVIPAIGETTSGDDESTFRRTPDLPRPLNAYHWLSD